MQAEKPFLFCGCETFGKMREPCNFKKLDRNFPHASQEHCNFQLLLCDIDPLHDLHCSVSTSSIVNFDLKQKRVLAV
jgi:hypothetical protein